MVVHSNGAGSGDRRIGCGRGPRGLGDRHLLPSSEAREPARRISVPARRGYVPARRISVPARRIWNAALCEANVDVVAVLLKQRILTVHVPASGGSEDVHVARGKLIAHRFIEAVAPANMTSIQDGLAFKAESVRLGHNRCDWASGELAKKLAIAKPLYCYQSERREIRDHEVLFAAVRADNDCAVAAVVDDDGVFPFTTRCQPSSAFAKLANTELSGKNHWSLATYDAKKAVSTLLHRVENAPIPQPENK